MFTIKVCISAQSRLWNAVNSRVSGNECVKSAQVSIVLIFMKPLLLGETAITIGLDI